jgi:hypothetical protein
MLCAQVVDVKVRLIMDITNYQASEADYLLERFLHFLKIKEPEGYPVAETKKKALFLRFDFKGNPYQEGPDYKQVNTK